MQIESTEYKYEEKIQELQQEKVSLMEAIKILSLDQ